MTNLVLILLAALFSVIRFSIPVHQPSLPGSYEAFAHLFVGGLIGAWAVSRKWIYMWIVLALSAVELFAFFTG